MYIVYLVQLAGCGSKLGGTAFESESRLGRKFVIVDDRSCAVLQTVKIWSVQCSLPYCAFQRAPKVIW